MLLCLYSSIPMRPGLNINQPSTFDLEGMVHTIYLQVANLFVLNVRTGSYCFTTP